MPAEAPLHLTVFKFRAKDEAGDGDEDVEYILINTERRIMINNLQIFFHHFLKFQPIKTRLLSMIAPAK